MLEVVLGETFVASSLFIQVLLCARMDEFNCSRLAGE